ncbi:MAG: glycine--tRNA ligase subunit beta [Armatimonadota bacterium]
MATVVLEIGTEEMPAEYQSPALAQLAELARAQFQAERIAVEEIHAWGTPRRLTIFATGVAEQQESAVREVRGPAVSAAFAANGEPTQAAIGFARSQGITVNDLRIKKLDNAEYVVAAFRDEGRLTVELLPTIFPAIITGLTFPKTMRWGSGAFRFARPIRWVVALLDEQMTPFTVDGVTAGRTTRGHRFLAPGEVEIRAAADYPRIMEENHVLVNPDERREFLRGQLDAIAQQDDATILDDDTLFEPTVFRVEYPTAVRGRFDDSFLSLPDEVLIWVLQHEQHYFPLADRNRKLLPAFIAVRNGDKAYLSTVREGYEAVARAKLLDALFFFEQDRQKPLADRVEDLQGVVFHERLGTMHDKVERVRKLAGLIAERLDLPRDDQLYTARAALLSRADLVTAMVMEHPGLQGAMGRAYARASGEPEAVAAAIGEHYLPRSSGDPIPSTTPGRIVALADKLDTLAACFLVGLIPTGSEDPYALRREAQGVVRILAEGRYRLSLRRLLSDALAQVAVTQAQPAEETLAALESFLKGRVETFLAGQGFSVALARAVLAVSADTPADALRRAQTIQARLDDPVFAAVTRISGRLTSITRDVAGDELREALLTQPAERELLARYQEVAPRAEFYAGRGEFDELLNLLAELAPAIDRFYDKILVMTEDPDLRQARLTLLKRLADLFRKLAELSMLGG